MRFRIRRKHVRKELCKIQAFSSEFNEFNCLLIASNRGHGHTGSGVYSGNTEHAERIHTAFHFLYENYTWHYLTFD